MIDAYPTLWQFNAKFTINDNITTDLCTAVELPLHRLHFALFLNETQMEGAKGSPGLPLAPPLQVWFVTFSRLQWSMSQARSL